MEAITFLKELHRCCRAHDSCAECPIRHLSAVCLFSQTPYIQNIAKCEDAVKAIEAWAKSNPQQTRGQAFLKTNPNCKRSDICPGIPDVRPCDYDESINYPAVCCRFDGCDDCRKAYWEEPVE